MSSEGKPEPVWETLANAVHARGRHCLPLDLAAVALAAGVDLYELSDQSPVDEIVLPSEAYYRGSAGRRERGWAIAHAIAGSLAAQTGACIGDRERDQLAGALLAPHWALAQVTLEGAIAELWWAPISVVVARWAECGR